MTNDIDGKININWANGNADNAALGDTVKDIWTADLEIMEDEGAKSGAVNVLTKFLESPDTTNADAALVFEALNFEGDENTQFDVNDLQGLEGTDVLAIMMLALFPEGKSQAARAFGENLGIWEEGVNEAMALYEEGVEDAAPAPEPSGWEDYYEEDDDSEEDESEGIPNEPIGGDIDVGEGKEEEESSGKSIWRESGDLGRGR